ncbi:hypothetical protein JOB18_003351 [Solea senegalensis]|uniref:Uncharacterized protein n=1 Tax=Solea senegalensis TaxID=28829 RepID=A0AAV6S6A9_SOLSE|nr:hypothetical protein JOB18_003351 [Solea senegalensis]
MQTVEATRHIKGSCTVRLCFDVANEHQTQAFNTGEEFIISATGKNLSTTDLHTPTAKQKHYGTTVPLLLDGQDWKPLSQLKPQVKTAGYSFHHQWRS